VIARALASAVLAFLAGVGVHVQCERAEERARQAERADRAEQKRAARAGKPRRIRYVRNGEVIATTFTATMDTEN